MTKRIANARRGTFTANTHLPRAAASASLRKPPQTSTARWGARRPATATLPPPPAPSETPAKPEHGHHPSSLPHLCSATREPLLLQLHPRRVPRDSVRFLISLPIRFPCCTCLLGSCPLCGLLRFPFTEGHVESTCVARVNKHTLPGLIFLTLLPLLTVDWYTPP